MAKGFWKKAFSVIGIEPEDVEEQGFYDDELDSAQDEYMEEPQEEEYYDFEEPKFSRRRSKVIEMPQSPRMTSSDEKLRMIIFRPSSYEETQSIIDNLKSRKPIVVNLDDLDIQIAQRILDFISGAVYALGGDIRKAARNIFVVVPSNVDISTNLAEDEHTDMQNII